jgi:actin cytoskeleton-regulatory complex protein SLA1
MYDYEPAAPGELAVEEGEILLVFETEQDWLLVQSQKVAAKAGFVPGNYVEAYSEEASPPAPQVVVPPSVRYVPTLFSLYSILFSLLDL